MQRHSLNHSTHSHNERFGRVMPVVLCSGSSLEPFVQAERRSGLESFVNSSAPDSFHFQTSL